MLPSMKRSKSARSLMLTSGIFALLTAIVFGWWQWFGKPLAHGRTTPTVRALLGGQSLRLESATMLAVFAPNIDGVIVNDGARPIRQDKIQIELLDDLGRVCQSARLFRERTSTDERANDDVRFVNPGDRLPFSWYRGSDELSPQWAGWKRMAEAERAGVHNNNAGMKSLMRAAGASSVQQDEITPMQGVDVSGCIRIRVAE